MSKPPLSVSENTEQTGDVNGLYNTNKDEKTPNIDACGSEQIIQNNDSWITLGRDKPISCGSGYGGKGHSRASAIDICVGRQTGNLNSSTVVANNPVNLTYNKAGDAARIYISQRADIDEYFGINEGSQGLSKAKSAIGMHADDIRIVARRGIKIVTGGAKQRDSLDNPTNGLLGIDLMAGNLDTPAPDGTPYLQSLVKGQNLTQALTQVVDEIAALNGVVNAFILKQTAINSLLINSPYIGLSAFGIPVVSFLNPGSLTTATTQNTTLLNEVVAMATQRNVVLNAIKGDYLLESGDVYICSRYNRTN